jgi:hypothetical protein
VRYPNLDELGAKGVGDPVLQPWHVAFVHRLEGILRRIVGLPLAELLDGVDTKRIEGPFEIEALVALCPSHRRAAGTRVALVAGGVAHFAKIGATGPLQDIAGEGGHVAELRARRQP